MLWVAHRSCAEDALEAGYDACAFPAMGRGRTLLSGREVERAEAGVRALVCERMHDAVDGRLVKVLHEELHAVAGVDDERVREVAHILPAAGGGEDLERGDGL